MQALGKDVRDLLALLEKHQVRFLIVGGFAVAVHATPRYTKDLDIWVECSSENADRLVRVIDEFGFSDLGVTAADFATPDLVIQLGYEPNRTEIIIDEIPNVIVFRFIDERAERREYWATQSAESRIREVESLRRMWIEVTGDPDRPIARVIHRRRLGDPAPRKPNG